MTQGKPPSRPDEPMPAPIGDESEGYPPAPLDDDEEDEEDEEEEEEDEEREPK